MFIYILVYYNLYVQYILMLDICTLDDLGGTWSLMGPSGAVKGSVNCHPTSAYN